MRRVLIFAAGFNEAGGIARRTRLISTALARRGWDVCVVSRSGPVRRLALTREPRLKVLEIPGFDSRRIGAALFLLLGVPAGFLWGRRASVLVAIQLASPAIAAAICSGFSGRPYVAMTTTSGQFSEAAYVQTGLFSPVRRWLLSRAALLVAQTDSGARELVTLVGEDRVVVVPNPVQVVQGPPLTGARRALFTGRLSEEKDLFRLLDAWRGVVSDRPDALLTLAGDGGPQRSVEEELRRTVASDVILSEHVVFTGWVDDVAPLLANSDVYVLPSTTEGMSNALLEACAWGRVVVASDIPSNRSILGDDYPLLFRTGDTTALSRAISVALDDEGVRRAAVAAITERIASFSVDSVIARLEGVLHDVACSGDDGRRRRVAWMHDRAAGPRARARQRARLTPSFSDRQDGAGPGRDGR
jgi:glycosyltransferase involved in cell wall biosynthesis